MKSELPGTLEIILRNNGWRLTLREINILQMIAENYTSKDIAFIYSISLNTLKKYKAIIYDKIGAESTPHAIAISMRAGIIK